jgi:hypothetical protein
MEPQYQNRKGLTDLSRHESIALVASVLCIKDIILQKDLENFDIEEIIYLMKERNGANNLQREPWIVDLRGVCSVLLYKGRPFPYNVGGNQRFSCLEIANMAGYKSHTSVVHAIQTYENMFLMNKESFIQGQFLGAKQPPMTLEQRARYNRPNGI